VVLHPNWSVYLLSTHPPQDIIHYENQKLVRYPGNLSQFVAKKPECRSYYELASTGGLKFKFPNPGRLDGINSNSKKVRRRRGGVGVGGKGAKPCCVARV
jgi:hypothetical protein